MGLQLTNITQARKVSTVRFILFFETTVGMQRTFYTSFMQLFQKRTTGISWEKST